MPLDTAYMVETQPCSSRHSIKAAMRALMSLALAVIGVAVLLCSSPSRFTLDEQHRNLLKQEQGLNNSTELRIASNIDRPLHVLSLGGSVTWGAAISERTDAYPFVLVSEILPPNSTVTNIAVRGTGADLAALCLQSMVLEGHAEQNPSVLDARGGHDIDYDIITVEYSINGIKNLDLLLRRLRQRYPRAIIVYIHVYSWQVEAVDEKSNGMLASTIRDKIWEDHDRETAWEWGFKLYNNPSHQWSWRSDPGHLERGQGDLAFLQRELRNTNSFMYKLPKHSKASNALPWFADDLHHINEAGHERVAHDVASIIDTHRALLESYPPEPSPGWGDGGGDQCVSWYSSGISNQVHVNKNIIPFAPSKFAAEVTKEDDIPLVLEVDNPYGVKMPMGLSTMSHEKVYPTAMVTLKSASNTISFGQTGQSSRQDALLDPFNRIESFRKNHVVQSQFIGYLEPGRNTISITPVERTREPLRVTGVIICKDCGLEEMVPGKQT